MKIFLLVIEIICGVALVGAVLLHSAKGEGLGGIGGQARIFSSQKDLESGLNKITAGLVISFLSIATILSLYFN